jgi:hypothetical protein
MKHLSSAFVLLLLALCAPAFAQDQPAAVPVVTPSQGAQGSLRAGHVPVAIGPHTVIDSGVGPGGSGPDNSCPSHQWARATTSGVWTCTQPAYTDISGPLPDPGATTLGGIESILSVAHKWIDSISTLGVPHQSQPACGDLSDAAASCNTDATNAANITSGTLPCGRLPALSGDTTSSAGSCTTTTGKVNGVSYGASPSTNTVPVVTGTNASTYELVPNAALANSSMTIGGQSVSLGGATTNQGNGAKLQLSTGTTTADDCVKYDVNGNAVDAGAGCGGSTSFANPTATCGTSAVNGSATTAMRSDAAPACPAGTNSTKGLVEGDGTTVNCVAGVCSALGFAPAGTPFHPGYVSGRWYSPPMHNVSTVAVSLAVNTIYATPFYVSTTNTFKAIGLVLDGSATGKFVELGIYADSGGAPGALVLDAGEVSIASITTVTITISPSLAPGWYWLACAHNNTSTVNVFATQGGMQFIAGSATLGASTIAIPTVSWTFSTGALPNPFGTPTPVSLAGAPLMGLQAN